MSLLLQLPRELRDMILSFVVTATIAAPTGPVQAEERSKRVGCYHPREFARCQKQWNRTKAIPTLLVNWQIHTETIELIDRIKDVDYALDIMMVNQEELWPTWLSVPRLSTKINKVSASIRTFGTSKNVPNSTVQSYTGNHPALIWSFYLLLQDLLSYGPASFWNKKTKANMVGVRTLELDFLTPNVPKELLSPSCLGTISLPQKRRNDGVDYIMHPQLLFNFVASNIAKLLDMRSGYMRYNSIILRELAPLDSCLMESNARSGISHSSSPAPD